eukprot:scaffold235404_cov19-Tisochrysis_lutea.AAC.2
MMTPRPAARLLCSLRLQLEQEDRLVGRDELHAPPEGVHISCCIDALSMPVLPEGVHISFPIDTLPASCTCLKYGFCQKLWLLYTAALCVDLQGMT